MTETGQALEQLLEQLADEIRRNVPTVSGKTKASIKVNIEEVSSGIATKIRGEIVAAKYFVALETGRGPTKQSGGSGKSLQKQLLEWIKTKGIAPAAGQTVESLSWAMATKIHREGNLLYRKGGKSGVISNVITPQRMKTFVEVFQVKAGKAILKNVLNNINH